MIPEGEKLLRFESIVLDNWHSMSDQQLTQTVVDIRMMFTDTKWHRMKPCIGLGNKFTVAKLEPYFGQKLPQVGIRELKKNHDGTKKSLGTIKTHNLHLAKALGMGVVTSLVTRSMPCSNCLRAMPAKTVSALVCMCCESVVNILQL